MYGDSDVDVVIRLDEVFYTDLHFLSDEEEKRYDAQQTPGSYGHSEFKTAVVRWLTQKYENDVQQGSKAVFISGSGARRDAHVLICAKLASLLQLPAIWRTYVC